MGRARGIYLFLLYLLKWWLIFGSCVGISVVKKPLLGDYVLVTAGTSDFDHWVAHLKSPRVHHVLDIHASILDTAFLYAQSVIISNGVCSSQGNDIYFKLQRSENDMIVILCSFLTQGRGTNFLVDNLFLTPTRRADVWPLVFNTSSLAAIILGPPGQRCHASSVFTRKTLFKVYARNAPGQHTYLS